MEITLKNSTVWNPCERQRLTQTRVEFACSVREGKKEKEDKKEGQLIYATDAQALGGLGGEGSHTNNAQPHAVSSSSLQAHLMRYGNVANAIPTRRCA